MRAHQVGRKARLARNLLEFLDLQSEALRARLLPGWRHIVAEDGRCAGLAAIITSFVPGCVCHAACLLSVSSPQAILFG